MGAKVLKMEGIPTAKKEPSRTFSYYSEDPKAQYLLMGANEQGKTVFFFKMQITGLHARMFGPYDSRSMAIDCYDTGLQGALESFCNVQNSSRRKGNNGMEHIALPENLMPVPVR
jgi:hypothetical protein